MERGKTERNLPLISFEMQFDSIYMKKENTETGRTRRNGGNSSLPSTTFKMMLVLVLSALIFVQSTDAG